MAGGRIQGITIEIDGNTTKLSQSLKGIDGQLNNTQKALKDIDKLLKLDPKNTELLTQKQKNLEKAISSTKDRLSELKNAQNSVAEGTDEWDRLQREIIATEQDLDKLKKQYEDFGSVAAQKVAAAGKQMEEFGGKVTKAGEALQPISTAATAALAGLTGLAYKAVTTADDLNTLAKQTGFTTEEIQQMQYAAELVDVSFEDIEGALKKLKPKITENNKALAELGVTTKNTDGTTRDAVDVFYDTIEALSKIPNETERDQKAMEIFGKSADNLAGIIDDGGAALRAYGQEAKDLGLIMEQDTVDSLNTVNDTIEKVKAQGGAALAKLGATVATTLAPVLEKVVGIIEKVTNFIAKLTPGQAELILKILAITAAISPLLKVGGKLISGIGTALTLAPKIATAIQLVSAALTPQTLLIAAIVAAVVALGVIIYKNWDDIVAWTKNMVDKVKGFFEDMKQKITTAVQNTRDKIVNTWNNIKDSVTNAASSVKNAVANAWDNMRTATVSKIENIRSSVTSTFQNLVSKIQGIFNFDFHLPSLRVPSWADMSGHFSNLIQTLKNAFKFDWSLPKIKLPHFTVKGGKAPWGLGGKGYLPSISVDWYKKAYQNAVMFTSPTVLPTGGGYKGFGDNGAEIVMGLNKLRELVGTSASVTVNVYGAPGQSVDAIADAVTRKIVNAQKQRNFAYA